MIKHKIETCGPRRTLLGGPKERRARKACQKSVMAFTRVVLALTNHTKVQARILTTTKARERTKKERAMMANIHNLGSQPRKHLMKKDMVMPGNQMTGLPASGLTIHGLHLLDGLAQKPILLGW